MRVGLYLTGKS